MCRRSWAACSDVAAMCCLTRNSSLLPCRTCCCDVTIVDGCGGGECGCSWATSSSIRSCDKKKSSEVGPPLRCVVMSLLLRARAGHVLQGQHSAIVMHGFATFKHVGPTMVPMDPLVQDVQAIGAVGLDNRTLSAFKTTAANTNTSSGTSTGKRTGTSTSISTSNSLRSSEPMASPDEDSKWVEAPLRLSYGRLGLTLTPAALAKLRQLSNLYKDKASKCLSLGVVFGGCHGFQYKFELVDRPTSLTKAVAKCTTLYDVFHVQDDLYLFHIMRTSDSHTSSMAGQDKASQKNAAIDFGLLLDIDTSFKMINGATLDYEKELIGSHFVIQDNPNADKGCGCGVSFGLKTNVD